MNERFETSELLDYYGVLLTEKQVDIMTLYFNEDLSLAEISELTNTSRQAIHDIIKRCHRSLIEYEEKLGLMSKNKQKKETQNRILMSIESLIEYTKDDYSLKELIAIKKDLMDNI